MSGHSQSIRVRLTFSPSQHNAVSLNGFQGFKKSILYIINFSLFLLTVINPPLFFVQLHEIYASLGF